VFPLSRPLGINRSAYVEKSKTGNIRSHIEERSRNHSWCGKAISIAYSERVFVALVIQRTKRMRRSLLTTVACQPLHCFLHIIS
jgi:hypothetical protein